MKHAKALLEAGKAIDDLYATTLDVVPRRSPQGEEVHELVSIARDHLARAAGIVDAAAKRSDPFGR